MKDPMESWLHKAARAAETTEPVKLGPVLKREADRLDISEILLCSGNEVFLIFVAGRKKIGRGESFHCPAAINDKTRKCHFTNRHCPKDAMPTTEEEHALLRDRRLYEKLLSKIETPKE
ncbi:MAG: hypothetical protein WCV72_00815 [Patescibacteria group bacterium]